MNTSNICVATPGVRRQSRPPNVAWVTCCPAPKQSYATQLEALWLKQLPIIPLFIGPRWSTYSTKYFHCFTSPKDYYGDPIFTTFPDNVLSFTRICAGGKAGA